MATQIDVCNMALAHLGVTEGIQNIQSDRTPQGIYLRQFYDYARRQVLGDVAWPFATSVQQLQLTGSSGLPGYNAFSPAAAIPQNSPFVSNPYQGTPQGVIPDPLEYGYSYLYPNDCLQFRRILSGLRNDVRQTRVPYRIMSQNNVVYILTDLQFAVGEYTYDCTNLDLASDSFVVSLAMLLASMIAPGLTKGDPNKLGARAYQFYQANIASAKAQAFNEEQPDLVPESEFIRGR